MHTKSAVLSTLACLTLSTMVLTCITGVRGGLSDALERVLQTSRSYYYTVRFPNPPSGSGLTRAKAQELLEILARSDFAKDVACVRTLDLPLVYYTRESSPAPGVPLPGAILVGFATLNYPLVVGEKPAQGRWFTREEVDKGADVCVAHTGIVSKSRAQVGSDLFSALPFEVESPSPACIQLVGIFGYSDVDSRIHAYLPWNHPWAVMTSHERTEVIYYVQPKPGFMEESMAESERTLKAMGGLPEWHMNRPPDAAIAYVRVVRSYLRSFLWVAVIGLAVACLNVGGVLLVLGQAEKRETGIKRAAGCSRFRSMLEFLVRGLMLALAGSLLGVALGCRVAPHVARLIGEQSAIGLKTLVLNVGIAGAACLVMTVVPALIAVRIDPVEAIAGQSLSRRGFLQMRAGSVIAVIGVIVALVSIVMIQGLGRVTEMNADKLIELGGRNGLVIQGYDPVDRVGLGTQRKFPLLDDFLQVRRLEDELGFKCAYLMSSIVNVASEENVVAVAVTGVAGEALKVKGLRAKWGTAEVGSGRCVLGYETARQLFGNPAKAVGRSVVVGDDVQVPVTGVLEPVPRGMVSKVVEPDETLYMPFEEAIRVRAFEVTPRGAEIFLRFGSEEALENGKERVISILPR